MWDGKEVGMKGTERGGGEGKGRFQPPPPQTLAVMTTSRTPMVIAVVAIRSVVYHLLFVPVVITAVFCITYKILFFISQNSKTSHECNHTHLGHFVIPTLIVHVVD